MKKATILAILVMLVYLSGCAVSDDPHEGGLMGYWHGTSSGRYEQRLEEKQARLEQERVANLQLNEENRRLETERGIQDRKLALEQKRFARIERKLARLNTAIDELQATTTSQKQEVASLKEKIRLAEFRIAKQKATIAELDVGGGSASDPDRVQALELERDRLADEYRKLNAYYRALADSMN